MRSKILAAGPPQAGRLLTEGDGFTPCTVPQLACPRLVRLEQLINNVAWLHRKDLMLRYSISAATLHRWINARRIPEPVRLSGRRPSLWRLVDLEAAEIAGRLPRPMSAKI